MSTINVLFCSCFYCRALLAIGKLNSSGQAFKNHNKINLLFRRHQNKTNSKFQHWVFFCFSFYTQIQTTQCVHCTHSYLHYILRDVIANTLHKSIQLIGKVEVFFFYLCSFLFVLMLSSFLLLNEMVFFSFNFLLMS